MTGEPVGRRAARMLATYRRAAAKKYTLDAYAGRRFPRDFQQQISGAQEVPA